MLPGRRTRLQAKAASRSRACFCVLAYDLCRSSRLASASPVAGGVWLGVARDIYIRYVDSDQYGTGTFETYLQAELNREGVHDLDKCHGSAIRKQRKANQTFILEQRAEMRARLLQLAMEGKLEYGQAELDGFGPS